MVPMVGPMPGSVIYQMHLSFPAPSIRAASYRDESIFVMAARKMMEFHPTSFKMSTIMTMGKNMLGVRIKGMGSQPRERMM